MLNFEHINRKLLLRMPEKMNVLKYRTLVTRMLLGQLWACESGQSDVHLAQLLLINKGASFDVTDIHCS